MKSKAAWFTLAAASLLSVNAVAAPTKSLRLDARRSLQLRLASEYDPTNTDARQKADVQMANTLMKASRAGWALPPALENADKDDALRLIAAMLGIDLTKPPTVNQAIRRWQQELKLNELVGSITRLPKSRPPAQRAEDQIYELLPDEPRER